MKALTRIVLTSVLTLAGIGLIGTWVLLSHNGRTPGELIRYAERRLAGYPKIEVVVLPVLQTILVWLSEPMYRDKAARFDIPTLPTNPAIANEIATPATPPQGPLNSVDQLASGYIHVIRVGPSRTIKTIASAATLARDGDVIEVDAGDYIADAAVWDQTQLTIRGVGNRVRLIASGAAAEDKAIWVVRRGRIVIENVDFVGARAPDRNGAGIRFESGHLTVRNCLFFDNENGLLAGDGGAELEIEDSEFGYNGVGDGLTHHLYVGNIKSLRVTGSYFHHANAGHLIKSRAANNYIAYNRLTDEIGGRASYELEFPNGGTALVIGNIIQQTAHTHNSTLISFGAEGYTSSTGQLYLINNTLVNDDPYGGAFLRVMHGAQFVRTQNNLLVGKGSFHTPDGRESVGDVRADSIIFSMAALQDYRLNASGRAYIVTPPGIVNGFDLTPSSEYVHPRQTRRLLIPPMHPGAIQSPGP